MESNVIKEFINFKKDDNAPASKAKVYNIFSNASQFILGSIKFNYTWRCYAVYPGENVYFTSEVLGDIKAFIDELTVEYLNTKK